MDGGLSDNLPILNDETITVSPFAGESDICPSDNSANFEHVILANTSMQLTSRNLYRISRALFPPHPSILSDMCTEGFDDCLKFLQKNSKDEYDQSYFKMFAIFSDSFGSSHMIYILIIWYHFSLLEIKFRVKKEFWIQNIDIDGPSD